MEIPTIAVFLPEVYSLHLTELLHITVQGAAQEIVLTGLSAPRIPISKFIPAMNIDLLSSHCKACYNF
jgi:hypothetical protein